jgi:hypothetical protein
MNRNPGEVLWISWLKMGKVPSAIHPHMPSCHLISERLSAFLRGGILWRTAAVTGLACFCACRPAAAAALVPLDRGDGPALYEPLEAAQILPHLLS